jgi:hypothetical protein
MPNDTTPLLPPDPSRSGFYYLTKPEWTGSIRNEIWRWSASDHTNGWSCHWQHESRAPMAAEWAARAGYTLATRHRIPTPGELEAVYALAARPTGPTAPASPFAVGYVAGMGYLAEKLRAALGGGA